MKPVVGAVCHDVLMTNALCAVADEPGQRALIGGHLLWMEVG